MKDGSDVLVVCTTVGGYFQLSPFNTTGTYVKYICNSGASGAMKAFYINANGTCGSLYNNATDLSGNYIMWSYYSPNVTTFYSDTVILNTVKLDVLDSNGQVSSSTAPQQTVSNADQYCYVTMPNDNYTSVSKVITYSVGYRIKEMDVSKINIDVLDSDNKPISSNANVNSYVLSLNQGQTDGSYYKGVFKFSIQYKDAFTGNFTLKVKVSTASYSLIDSKSVTIRAFTDANGDGKDDVTGEDAYIGPASGNLTDTPTNVGSGIIGTFPNKANYEDSITGKISYAVDCILWFFCLPFNFLITLFTTVTSFMTSLVTLLGGITTFFTRLFAFMPPQFTTIAVGTLAVGSILTIFKYMRG